MPRTTIRCGLMVAILMLPAAACPGQSIYLSQTYGQGVHALFRGNIDQAKCLFDQAINNGSQDPRAYYYRAILSLYLGASYEARSDVQLGAELEAQGSGSYDIGMALERVQGQTRLEFECLRREAMLAISQRSPAGLGSESNQLFDPAVIRPPVDPGRTTVETPDVLPPDMTDPFEDEDDQPIMGEESSVPDEEEPFPSDDAMDTDAPADDAVDDPFGDDAGAEADDDPFGQPEVDPADDDDPFASDGLGDNPFALEVQEDGDPLSGLFD